MKIIKILWPFTVFVDMPRLLPLHVLQQRSFLFNYSLATSMTNWVHRFVIWWTCWDTPSENYWYLTVAKGVLVQLILQVTKPFIQWMGWFVLFTDIRKIEVTPCKSVSFEWWWRAQQPTVGQFSLSAVRRRHHPKEIYLYIASFKKKSYILNFSTMQL